MSARHPLLPLGLGALLPVACAAMQTAPPRPVDSGPYRDERALEGALRDLVDGSGGVATLASLGTSREGRPIHLLELGTRDGVPLASRPAILLVAGLDGAHLAGTEVAIGAARSLLQARASDPAVDRLFASAALFVVPRANPDGVAARFAEPRTERPGNGRPYDDDRDGRVDEDGPNDLDGDGWIVRMRVENPEGTFVADDEDPRATRAADPLRGEHGRWSLESEGIDDDGDGRTNEDPPGDARPDRNFPQGHPEHGADAGAHAGSEPETRALLDFCIARSNLAAIVVYGRHDNLVTTPADSDAAADDGARGAVTRVFKSDLPILKEIGERYRDLTGSKAKGEKADEAGSFVAWASFQLGIPAFAATLWRPDLESAAASRPASVPASAPVGTAPAPASRPSKKDEAIEEERKRLRWADAFLGDAGFVPWHPVSHPEHGTVEVGGWKPYALANPPAGDLPALAEKEARFLAALGEFLPRVRVASLSSIAKGGDLHAIEAAVENAGRLPTATTVGRRTGRAKPVRVRLVLPEGTALVAGERQMLLPRLAGGGGREELRWIVRGAAGSEVRVEVSADRAGADAAGVRLGEGTPR